MRGVIGGGQTRDEIDGLCGELYKCYKCLNLDHAANDAMFNYEVDMLQLAGLTHQIICSKLPAGRNVLR